MDSMAAMQMQCGLPVTRRELLEKSQLYRKVCKTKVHVAAVKVVEMQFERATRQIRLSGASLMFFPRTYARENIDI